LGDQSTKVAYFWVAKSKTKLVTLYHREGSSLSFSRVADMVSFLPASELGSLCRRKRHDLETRADTQCRAQTFSLRLENSRPLPRL